MFGKPKPKPKVHNAKGSVVADVTSIDQASMPGSETLNVGLHMSSSDADGLNLSDNQCKQLIQLLQKSLTGSQSSQTAYASATPAVTTSNGNSSWLPQHSINHVQLSGNHMVH